MKTQIKQKINLKNYKGEAFIGIDVHRLTYSVAIVINRTVVKKFQMPADNEQFIAVVRKLLPQAKLFSVYEAGFSGYTLHRTLEKAHISNIIVNPASIQVASKNKVKTDKLDSIKLAQHLSLGLLSGIRIVSSSRENQRLLSRTRRMLVKDRVRMMARVRARLLQFNLLPIDYNQVLTLKYVKGLQSQGIFSKELNNSLSILLKIWEEIEFELKNIERVFKTRSKDCPVVKKYMEIPGIGLLSAIVFADELGDCSQFANEKSLFSFLGLTPSEHSSGKKIKKGEITRQGNPQLRFMLIECAWVTIQKDPILKATYGRIAARRGGKKAIVAIARKLIGRARSILINNSEYEINYNRVKTLKKAA